MLMVKQVMTTPVVSIAANALVEDALDLMLQNRISGLIVVDDDDQLVGVISEFDALTLITESPDASRLVEPVARFMTTQVEAIDEDQPIEIAAEIFRRKGVIRLPVLRDGKVVGVLSRSDLVSSIRERRCLLALNTSEFGAHTYGLVANQVGTRDKSD